MNVDRPKSVEEAKFQARVLHKAHPELKYGQALHQFAQAHGYRSWQALIAILPEKVIKAPTVSNQSYVQMTLDDIRAVLASVPTLTHFGMGVFDKSIMGTNLTVAIHTGQEELLAALDECNKCCRFLQHVEKRKTSYRKVTSYGLKHSVEHYLRHTVRDRPSNAYVSNGAFICAAVHLGFKLDHPDTSNPNVCFNMSAKSPVFVWRRLLGYGRDLNPKQRAQLDVLAERIGVSPVPVY